MVLLDRVQFPLGRSWMTRNRVKGPEGFRWLTVPVKRKGRGGQRVAEVEICEQGHWRAKHLETLRHCYRNAPYWQELLPLLEEAYRGSGTKLVDLNWRLINLFQRYIPFRCRLLLQSQTGVEAKGTALVVALCRELNADRYLNFTPARKHVDSRALEEAGVEPLFLSFRPPVYPQLWGPFLYNLSVVDLAMNCGPKSGEVILRDQPPLEGREA